MNYQNFRKKQTWILAVASVLCCLATCGCGDAGAVQAGGGRFTSEDYRTWYTIRLRIFRGDRHAAEAARYERSTARLTGWNDLFVATEGNRSMLCWGKYDSIENSKAQRRLIRAKAWAASPNDAKIYQFALIVPLRGANPGPPEWDLANADGAHTVKVAEFYDVPKSGYVGRKKFALEYCHELRKRDYEAYFHHGLFKSIVTIGTFPSMSVRRIQTRRGIRIEVRDSRIRKITLAFPQLAVNGAGERIGGIDVPSKIIPIPRTEDGRVAVPVNSRSHP